MRHMRNYSSPCRPAGPARSGWSRTRRRRPPRRPSAACGRPVLPGGRATDRGPSRPGTRLRAAARLGPCAGQRHDDLPVLVGGLLIVGTAGGDLVALDARTGEERWRGAGGGRFAGAPAADAGIVVAADAASIRAFDAATGASAWQREVVSDAPRIEIADGVVYVGTIDGAVKGLDLQTGDDRWSWQGDRGLSVRVDIVADGVVYANPNDGRLLAIDLADGSERWRFLSRASVLGYMMADDTLFVNGARTRSRQRSTPATGQVRWRFVPPSGDAAWWRRPRMGSCT